MDYSFGIDSFEGYWSLTKTTVAQYLDDNLNVNLAIDCAHKLWHLCDWYYEENKDSLGYTQLSDLQGEYGANCHSLRVMRDVCNGSKPASLTKTKTPVIKATREHDGPFSSQVFSRDFFNVPALEVELVDGTKVYFDEAVKKTFIFWQQKIQH